MILTLFAKMVLRYRAELFPSAPPFVSVVAMLPSRIVLLLVILATLNDRSYQERAVPAASVFPRYPISWTSTDLFRLLDNNVVATFVSHCRFIKCVLASELVQVAIWLS